MFDASESWSNLWTQTRVVPDKIPEVVFINLCILQTNGDMIYRYKKMPSQGPTWKVVCGLPPWGKPDEQQHFCRHFHSAKKIYAEKILYAEER